MEGEWEVKRGAKRSRGGARFIQWGESERKYTMFYTECFNFRVELQQVPSKYTFYFPTLFNSYEISKSKINISIYIFVNRKK